MRRSATRIALLGFAAVPFLVAIAQPQGQTAEQVYKDIQVFKGLPAGELIPAMQFMSAAMDYQCTDCHVPNDYAADHKKKTDARKMVLLQRDINEKHFNGKLEVTCMTCHNKKDHPEGMPLPTGVRRRHEDLDPAPAPQELLDAHVAISGSMTAPIVRTGTLTAPNDATHKLETVPLEFIQAPGGKYRVVAGDRKFGSDGTVTWYGEYPMADEPRAIFDRIGRTWVGDADFKGLGQMAVYGKETVGSAATVVVQAYRKATSSAEELYFDVKSKRLVRLVNFRRSTLGTVVSAMDFSDYKLVGAAHLPMKVVITFAAGEPWVMELESAKVDPSVKDETFKLGG